MASSGCGGGGGGEGQACSAGCQNLQQQQQSGSFGSWVRRHGSSGEAGSPTTQQQQHTPARNEQQQRTCMKCKAVPSVTNIRQNEPYCHGCIEAGVQQRVRVATKGLGLISAGDRALLALSGGAASAALLHCMASMQQPANSQRPGKGKVVFQMTVLHVDCSMQPLPGSAATAEKQRERDQLPHEHWQQLRSQLAALAAAAGYDVEQQQGHLLLLLHLSDMFCSDQQLQDLLAGQQQQQQQQQQPQQQQVEEDKQRNQNGLQKHQQQHQQQQQLQQLLSAVSDPTGREDLLTALRDQLLLRAAAVLGCNRLLRGDSASRMAVKVIAEAAKGRGFSLPADLQCFDGRHAPQGGPCILQPLREVTHKELQELCSYKGLPLLLQQQEEVDSGNSATGLVGVDRGANNVNALSERFIQDMEGSLPASIYTIIRTAAHLQPFGFTHAPALVPAAAAAARKLQSGKQQQQAAAEEEKQAAGGRGGGGGLGQQPDARVQWPLCRLCQAPLPDKQPDSVADGGSAGSSSSGEALCYSCNRQVLQQVKVDGAADVSPLEQKMQRLKQLLPPGMLLESDSEAGDE